LVTLDRLPAGASIRDIRLIGDLNASQGGTLTPDAFRHLLDRAELVDAADPSIQQWAYAPWYRGSFASSDGTYHFQLYLGGRGRLPTPHGTCGLFQFPPARH
jgi:hypothetical protein